VLPASAAHAADAQVASDPLAAEGEASLAYVAPQPVDPVAVQAAFDRLSAIFSDMMVTVAEVSTHRCPYKNRLDKCTAKFGCRNQLRPTEPGGLKVCGGDDKLDYRSAWETS
jgi:hypothetical protein